MAEVAVLGATGYTGIELVRLLNAHPDAEAVFLSSDSNPGKKISEVHPQFSGQVDLVLEPMQVEKIPGSVEVVFCALPHGSSAGTVAELLKQGFRVIDLSADFRLKEADLYREWYKLEHPQEQLLKEAVYGIPELYRSEIAGARLVANPGCYPTSTILALAPLLNISPAYAGNIIIDAKSGVSGAGREPKQPFHFPECSENFKAYRVASHQHTPEIEQELSRLAGEPVMLTFTPHLVPMIRGILSTIYAGPIRSNHEIELNAIYSDFYENSPFIRVLKPPALPETRLVRGSNYCDLALKVDERTDRLIIISAIDNLVKGAAGQALQNMNIMFGLEESLGLEHLPC